MQLDKATVRDKVPMTVIGVVIVIVAGVAMNGVGSGNGAASFETSTEEGIGEMVHHYRAEKEYLTGEGVADRVSDTLLAFTSNVEYVNGKGPLSGGAISVSNGKAAVQDGTAVSRSDGMALTQWVYVDEFTDINVFNSDTPGTDVFAFYTLGNDLSLVDTGNNGECPIYAYNMGTALAADEWHHLAVSYRDGAINVFHNGNLVHTIKHSCPLDTRAFTTDAMVGTDYLDKAHYSFVGMADEVTYHDRPLDESQVVDIMQGNFGQQHFFKRIKTGAGTLFINPQTGAANAPASEEDKLVPPDRENPGKGNAGGGQGR